MIAFSLLSNLFLALKNEWQTNDCVKLREKKTLLSVSSCKTYAYFPTKIARPFVFIQKKPTACCCINSHRTVGRSENPGVPVLFGGHNLPPLGEIGLTDLPKCGGAMAPPAPPGTTDLISTDQAYNRNLRVQST